MQFKQLMTRLEVDSRTLTRIEEAYSATSPSRIVLLQPDERAFRRTVLALRDLFTDEMPSEDYGDRIEKLFQFSLANAHGSPDQDSVRDINDLIATIIARLRRLGKVPDPPIEPRVPSQKLSRDEIPYPPHVTLAWLRDSVPVKMWLSAGAIAITLLSAGFYAGIWWAETGNRMLDEEQPAAAEQPLQDSDP